MEFSLQNEQQEAWYSHGGAKIQFAICSVPWITAPLLMIMIDHVSRLG